jgi:hypothetical protein
LNRKAVDCCYLSMTAIALLHPNVSPKVVERFKCSGIELRIQDSLEEKSNCSVALIFGGDGTVHRHLPQLYKQKIPMLVVPTGSGNDFAKTLGIGNEQTALLAWQQFCAEGKNVREIDLGVIRSANGEEIFFCCVAGVGLDADANARANRDAGEAKACWRISTGCAASIGSVQTGGDEHKVRAKRNQARGVPYCGGERASLWWRDENYTPRQGRRWIAGYLPG